MPEGKGKQNAPLLNLVTGGERSFLARGIKEKEIRVRATAHLVMQANLPEGGEPEIQFGVAGRSDANAAAALRERMYLLPMPRIPQEQRNPAYLSISADGKAGSQEFRQAWVARTVRQCMAMVDQPWPARLESQAEALADLQHRETDAWLTEWLENALVDCAGSQVHLQGDLCGLRSVVRGERGREADSTRRHPSRDGEVRSGGTKAVQDLEGEAVQR